MTLLHVLLFPVRQSSGKDIFRYIRINDIYMLFCVTRVALSSDFSHYLFVLHEFGGARKTARSWKNL